MPSPKKTAKTTKGAQSQIKETRVISKQISTDELLNAAGASGTYIVNGFLENDYNSKLSGEAGLEVYDEMRKADSQVRASLMVCMLPLLSTEWYFDAAKDVETDEVGEAEQEVADFCSKALFEKMDISWTAHLTEVLTLLPFGFSVFEKVYTADEEDDFIWLKTLGGRKQKTIVKWEMEDGSAGVVQQLPSAIVDPEHPNVGLSKVSIPASKLLLFSYQKEGDNYAGISVLRSAYKHWYIKDALYKFDAIRHERQGVGIPVIKLPKGATVKDIAEARAILKNIRANEQGGIVLPNPAWEFMFADLQAGNVSDIWKSIEHHNREIAKNVLAQFLELGNTESGSRALSEDQSDFFLLALEALANLIEDVYNRHLIPELVDLNFEVTDYPKLRHRKLGSVDYQTISSVLSTAVSSGIVTVDEDIEEWFRNLIDAPKKVILEEEIDPLTGEPIDPNEDPSIDPETGLPIDPTLEPLDDNGDPLEPPEVDDNGDPIQANEEELYQLGDSILMFNDSTKQWYEDDGEGFYIVSEETKKKISDSLKKAHGGVTAPPPRYKRGQPVPEDIKKKISEGLKKALPGDTEQTAARLKAEALARKNMRHQKALANARARKTSKVPQGNSLIAQRSAQRLKKAGVKDTAARRKSNLQNAQDAINGKHTAPPKKKSKLGRAINKLVIGRKARRAKRVATLKKSGKSIAKVVKKTKKMSKKVKVASGLPKLGDSLKVASTKKKLHAHEVTEYEMIFSETAKSILAAQASLPRTPDPNPPKAREFKENTYKSWRPLTFAEQKVDLKSLSKTINKFKTALNSEIDTITADQKADLLKQVQRAVEGNDIVSIGTLRAKYTGDLSTALTNVQKELFEAGKVSASTEMNVRVPGTAREVMGALKVGNDKLVEKLTNDMENAASSAVSQTVARKGGSISGTGTAEAVNAASEAIDKVLESKGRLHTLTIMGSLNLGRASIFERYPEKVYGFQYSAIIDDKTTDLCLSLDGRVVAAGSADFYSYGPPQHYNCRSLWVEILQDEEFKPETDDIPSRIPSNSSIDVFQDLKAPVVLENSPAIKIMKKEIEERQAQIDSYKASGLYSNRIASHQARINDLEDALGDNVSLGSIDITEKQRVEKGGK